MKDDVGKKIKDLRNSRNLTLKELSSETDLSIGFLSQLERGLTTVAIDSLDKIAKALQVNLSYFLEEKASNRMPVLKEYENEVFQIVNNQFIHYHLTNDGKGKNLLPRLIKILPTKSEEEVTVYQHEGEEFVYVLEGILTLFIDNQRYELYPGDSAHYESTVVHNWANYTNKMVKILTVHTPNVFKD